MFADDVDGALLRGGKVAQRVLCVGEAAGDADGEEGRVVVDDIGVGEGGEVGGGAYIHTVKARVSANQRGEREGIAMLFRGRRWADRLRIVC